MLYSRFLCIHYPCRFNNTLRFISLGTQLYLPNSKFNYIYYLKTFRYYRLYNGPKILKENTNNLPTSSNGNKFELKSSECDSKKLSIFARFKQAYKIHGKVLVIAHCMTSICWFGMFYFGAINGINAADLLEALHAPDWMLSPFNAAGGGVGVLGTTYLLYKTATPLRYGVTLWLTRFLVRHLRRDGRVPQIADQDRLRNLAREGARLSRDRLRSRIQRTKERTITRVREFSSRRHRNK